MHCVLIIVLAAAGCTSDADNGPSLDMAVPNAMTPHCRDGVRDGDETDVDCGGASCSECDVGAGCLTSSDCRLGVCLDSTCRNSNLPVQLHAAVKIDSVSPGGAMAAGRLDADPDPDLVVIGEGLLSSYRGSATGSFSPSGTLGSPYARGVKLVDLNGDRHLDALMWGNFIVNSEEMPPPTYDLSWAAGDGTGGLHSLVELANLLDGEIAAVPIAGDWNGDGLIDILLGISSVGTSWVSLLPGAGRGTFAGQALMTMLPLYPCSSLVAGDWNRDGAQDVAAGFEGSFLVYLGAGDGSFHAGGRYALDGRLIPGTASDFDGDGLSDLVGLGDSSSLSFFAGRGDGTFAAALTSPGLTTYGLSTTFADLDGDGRLDVVAVTASDSGSPTRGIMLLAGGGDGTFTLHLLVGGITAWSIIALDVNRDGRPDVLTLGDDGLRVFLNAGRP